MEHARRSRSIGKGLRLESKQQLQRRIQARRPQRDIEQGPAPETLHAPEVAPAVISTADVGVDGGVHSGRSLEGKDDDDDYVTTYELDQNEPGSGDEDGDYTLDEADSAGFHGGGMHDIEYRGAVTGINPQFASIAGFDPTINTYEYVEGYNYGGGNTVDVSEAPPASVHSSRGIHFSYADDAPDYEDEPAPEPIPVAPAANVYRSSVSLRNILQFASTSQAAPVRQGWRAPDGAAVSRFNVSSSRHLGSVAEDGGAGVGMMATPVALAAQPDRPVPARNGLGAPRQMV